jgi:PAS domain S-box-containing protein
VNAGSWRVRSVQKWGHESADSRHPLRGILDNENQGFLDSNQGDQAVEGKRPRKAAKAVLQQADENQQSLPAQRRRKPRQEEALAGTLHKERDILQVIMENTGAQLVYLDTDFNFVKVNSAYARGSGHTAEELIGKNHFAFFPNPENQAIFEKVRDTGEPVQYTAKPFTFADQPERGVTYWDWTLSPVKDASGRVQGLVLSLVDVTEQTRGHQALAEQRLLLETILEQAADGIMVCDSDGKLLLVNAAARRMTGLGPGQAAHAPEAGRSYDSEGRPVPPQDRVLARALRGEVVVGLERHLVRPDGSSYDVLASAAPVRNAAGQIVAAIRTFTEITERKRAEEQVEGERRRLQALLDTAPIGIIVVNTEGGVVLTNPEAAHLVGLSGEPVEWPQWYEQGLVRRRPDGRAYEPEEFPVQRALHRGESVRAEEVWLEFPDGHTIPTLVDATPIHAADGQIVGAIAVIQDITPLEEVEKLRSEFLAMVSHELKTPLTAIKGAAATFLGSSKSFDGAQTRELFDIIDEQAERLREMVDDLLDMTRIEAGALSVSPEPVDLGAVLEEVRATFARSAGWRDVRFELPPALPAVSADRRRISQVLLNLLANAAKFSSPDAPITVAVERNDGQVTVHVRDRGRGIPADKLPHLFKKFSQVHEGPGGMASGSGLGLAICKGIVEAHGGRIWAESAGEGLGATFSFALPVAADTSVESPSGDAHMAVPAGRIRRPGERTRVLAVDDEPQVLRYLRRSLDEAGYQTVVTSDPSQVVRLVELEEPDLVLLDLRLPGTSGFELLQQIREFSGVPVIFLTASDRDDDTVRALEMGADDYITKPFSPSELLARIGAVLRRRAAGEEPEMQRPFVVGDLTVNFAERRVTVGNRAVALSATEYRLLHALAAHGGRVLTYDQILHNVWGPEYGGETEIVRSFIRNLRRKLGDDARQPRYIFTEPQVGYRMPSSEV